MKQKVTSGGLSIRSDCHMHTEFSTDSQASVRSMLDAAAECGLGRGVYHGSYGFLIFHPRRERLSRRERPRSCLMRMPISERLAPLKEAYSGAARCANRH